MSQKTLQQIVTEHPYPDYADWWDVGPTFLSFMAAAIVPEWAELHGNDGRMETVSRYLAEYIQTVFHRAARPALVADFAARRFSPPIGSDPIQSGEFDALSYAFYRSAFELIEAQSEAYLQPFGRERRSFTQRVGKRFYSQAHKHLNLDLPARLVDEQDFDRLKDSLRRVGAFLKTEGYLRDHFDFRFTLDETHAGKRIRQSDSDFIPNLEGHGTAYALYEMGYPIILPSAVYLYHTIGEAQHHSSRTIEELFNQIGYEARETDDFDPSHYPSDRVVELWEIQKQA